jgi:hypothetical protein
MHLGSLYVSLGINSCSWFAIPEKVIVRQLNFSFLSTTIPDADAKKKMDRFHNIPGIRGS